MDNTSRDVEFKTQEFRVSDKDRLVGTREISRGLSPVFPSGPKNTLREENYIRRMIVRDRELGWV